MRSDRYPSLEIVFGELKALLERQAAHIDAVDSKASIVIGFTALVLGVAVGGDPPTSPFVTTGVSLGALSFVTALRAFWVRSYATLPKPREFYVEFAGADEEQSTVVLCNLAVAAFEQNAPILQAKVRTLKLALALLILAIASFVLAFFVEGVLT